MSDYHPYIRFMSDIIDSGVWAELSSAAKTLYPVLLKFSDSKFKPVWPGTETLLRLTGFKTKKSIVQAKKELVHAGLLFQVPGSGKVATRYHFSFHYPGSKITPLRDTQIHQREGQASSPAGDNHAKEGVTNGNPNHINITISNHNQSATERPEEKKTLPATLESLLELFGNEMVLAACTRANALGLGQDWEYIKSLCKEQVRNSQKMPNSKQENPEHETGVHQASWRGFLDWASQNLSAKTWRELDSLDVQIDGKVLLIASSLNAFHRQIIEKYFNERAKPPLLVVFGEREEPARISEIR
ncbi:hypothetical protein LPTSP4_34660 [Leptospira ryugenii]|uniref:DNA-binding helix-turn-helix protein n=1 Tax=Leptospira ryugenii TaxID=1917863 RepID=A0A2P2E4X2_9LEPT|nr:helix-turn-helix domain-containing protein [Leptospira ryugenii]GBF51928.1 hypothetical protein LPTSP4_34660 [Leptospira ryugenii]